MFYKAITATFFSSTMLSGLISFRPAVARSSISRAASTWAIARAGISTLPDNPLPSKPSPLLMLPTAFRDGGLVYNFYSLEEDRRLSFIPRRSAGDKQLVDDDAVVVGSGHGWLATFNFSGNHDLFLSHPISGEHIKLPPMIITPAGFFSGPANGLWSLSIILSSSPDKDECRAVMSLYGVGVTALAYCLPGRCAEWNPLCGLVESQIDVVHSKRQQRFICISIPRIRIESWDLHRHPQSPRMVDDDIFEDEIEFDYGNCHWAEEELDQLDEIRFVVLEEESDDLYIVRRIIDNQRPVFETLSFLVFKIDRERRRATYISVGPTMFLGADRSFALSAMTGFPRMKPNSIYFTSPSVCEADDGPPSIDVGIYDYDQGTMDRFPCSFDVEGVRVGMVRGPCGSLPAIIDLVCYILV